MDDKNIRADLQANAGISAPPAPPAEGDGLMASDIFGAQSVQPAGYAGIAATIADDEAARLLIKAIDDEAPPAAKTPAPLPAADAPHISASRMSDVHALPVDWLWHGRIAIHALTIVEGAEGLGKSTLLTALAAAVTTGAALPGDEARAPQTVLWLSAEDDLARVLRPRLDAAKADCERVYAVGDPFRFDASGLLALRELIATHTPRLVIVDPIFAFASGDGNKGSDTRALTNDLKSVAEQFDCAIVLVRHIGKARGLGDPRAAGLGSTEWRAAARSVLLVGADPDQPARRAVAHTKHNLGPLAESLGYEIRPDAESPSGARFFWSGASDLTAERMLATVGNLDEAQDRNDAADFLRQLLAGGPVESADVMRAARAAGVTDYALKRAKSELRIRPRKVGGRFGAGPQKWEWALPAEDGDESPEDGDTFQNSHLLAKHSDKSSYDNKLAEEGEKNKYRHLQAVSPSSVPRAARAKGDL